MTTSMKDAFKGRQPHLEEILLTNFIKQNYPQLMLSLAMLSPILCLSLIPLTDDTALVDPVGLKIDPCYFFTFPKFVQI